MMTTHMIEMIAGHKRVKLLVPFHNVSNLRKWECAQQKDIKAASCHQQHKPELVFVQRAQDTFRLFDPAQAFT